LSNKEIRPMASSSKPGSRPFLWMVGLVGEVVAGFISIAATMVNFFLTIAMLAFSFVFLHEHVVNLIPFLPNSWHGGVALVLAVIVTVFGMMVLEVVLILAFLLVAVLLIQGCVWIGEGAQALYRRIKG